MPWHDPRPRICWRIHGWWASWSKKCRWHDGSVKCGDGRNRVEGHGISKSYHSLAIHSMMQMGTSGSRPNSSSTGSRPSSSQQADLTGYMGPSSDSPSKSDDILFWHGLFGSCLPSNPPSWFRICHLLSISRYLYAIVTRPAFAFSSWPSFQFSFFANNVHTQSYYNHCYTYTLVHLQCLSVWLPDGTYAWSYLLLLLPLKSLCYQSLTPGCSWL